MFNHEMGNSFVNFTLFTLVGSDVTVTAPGADPGSFTITAGLDGFVRVLRYNGSGNFTVSVKVAESDTSTAIGIYNAKSENIMNILPGEEKSMTVYGPPNDGTSFYTINAPSSPIAVRWSFYSIIEGGVECGVYIQPSGTNSFVQYANQRYVTANNGSPTVSASFNIIPPNGTLGILVPGEFVIYNASNQRVNSSFDLVSSTTNPSMGSIAYATNTNGVSKVTPFSTGTPAVNFTVLNIQARFYIIPRGKYSVRFEDTGKQAKAEAAEAARQLEATLRTVKTVLDIVKQTTGIVKDVADIAGKVVALV